MNSQTPHTDRCLAAFPDHETEIRANVAAQDAERIAAGKLTLDALVLAVLDDDEASTAVYDAMIDAGIFTDESTGRSQAEHALSRIMDTLKTFGYDTRGTDWTPGTRAEYAPDERDALQLYMDAVNGLDDTIGRLIGDSLPTEFEQGLEHLLEAYGYAVMRDDSGQAVRIEAPVEHGDEVEA